MTRPDSNDISADIREYVTYLVDAGFESPADIAEAAVVVHAGDAEPDMLMSIAEKLTREAVEAHRHAQATWPDITDCDRLDAAFEDLNRNGIVCRQNFTCCGTCGAAEIRNEMEAERGAGLIVRGYAFYHAQDTEAATRTGRLFLNYGAVEEGEDDALIIGREIVATLQRHGLTTVWDRTWETRIGVRLDWKKRR